MVSKYIPTIIKKMIAMSQNNKCANSPSNKSTMFNGYKCLLWKHNKGYFDNSGYQIDHIIEYCISKNNHISNLQALCPNCHSVKTNIFIKNKNK